MRVLAAVYCDGGLMVKNPSPIGGTFAFVLVDEHDQEIESTVGIVTPGMVGLPTISNNLTELIACVQAMLYVPAVWSGTIYTDSFVTLCRLTGRQPKMNGIPQALQEKMWEARKRLGKFKVTLLDGHPTKAQLASGIGKRGNPVSKWNVLCDKLCTERAREFLDNCRAKPDAIHG